LDNPLWVAHMPHPTDYDYDGFPPILSYPTVIPATVALVEAASRLFSSASFDAPAALFVKAATLVRVGGRSS